MAPMPAVTAMANAPQKVTRIVAPIIMAPPACAPAAPSNVRNTNDAIKTDQTTSAVGTMSAMISGNAAPRENEAADARAA